LPPPAATLFPYTTLFRSRLTVRAREPRDVAGHPQPQPLHLDRLALIDDVVIDAGSPGLGKKSAQARVTRRRRGEGGGGAGRRARSEEHTSELQSRGHLVC